MRQLTFSGFLEQYVVSLSVSGSSGVYSLVREAKSTNPRIREPLLLYALATNRVKTLLTASVKTPMYDEYFAMANTYSYEDMLRALSSSESELPVSYQKVWRSYQAVVNKHERDNRVKRLMRSRIADMQNTKKVTTYRLCKDLNLNNANVNAWIKHDLPNKVSIDTARKIMDYLETC